MRIDAAAAGLAAPHIGVAQRVVVLRPEPGTPASLYVNPEIAWASPERVAGAVLVTQPAAVLATGTIAAARLAGLCMRHMPFRGRLVAVLGAGVMGAAIAAHIANAGVPVLLLDIPTDEGKDRSAIAREAIARLLPGVIGNAESLVEESHEDGLLEYPVYTKPADWNGRQVPEILLSGDHGRIAAWRHQQRLERTAARRPDMYEAYRAEHPEA